MKNDFIDPNISSSPYPRLFSRTYEKPKSYDYIPESFKLIWEDPHKFIPDKVLSQFNERMFLNFIHRECFNSCLTNSATLSEYEKSCYKNCQNKHLMSLGTFKEALMARRKWRGWKNYVSLKEYSRTPEEMATDFPTDPIIRGELLKHQEMQFEAKQKIGLRELFNSKKEPKNTMTIFDLYFKGRFPADSKVAKEKEANQRKDIYNEYRELSEKYGDRIAELLKKKVNMNDWKDVPGDNWTPEEEEAVSEDNASQGIGNEESDS